MVANLVLMNRSMTTMARAATIAPFGDKEAMVEELRLKMLHAKPEGVTGVVEC